MKLFLARHGETTGNSQGLILGQKDYPLTVEGIRTAEKMADKLRNTASNGVIISSPLGRALQTAGIYAGRTGWRIEVAPGMAELSCGSWEGMKRSDVLTDRTYLRVDWTDAPPGGESCSEAEPRVSEVISKINEMGSYDNTLVIGHAGVNRVFLKLWLNEKTPIIAGGYQPHGLVYLIEGKRDVRWMDVDGRNGAGLSFEHT